jgi:prevent-host-death family protein
MKSIEDLELERRFAQILDDAQQEPIVIRRAGQDIAAIVSAAEYERLREADIRSFLDLRKQVAAEAADNGLTARRLAALIRRT